MGTLELKIELHKYVESGDRQLLDVLYESAKTYLEQRRLDGMIAEGEEDTKAGRVHSQEEVQKMINMWTEE